MRLTKKAIAVGVAGTALALTVGTVAVAQWSSTGTGAGTAATSSGASNLTITQTGAPTDLAPGVAAGTITATVTNNAANSAYVHTVTVSIDSVTKATGATGTCDASDYTLTGGQMTVDQDVAAGGTATATGALLAFNDKAGVDQDGCKGATVNLAYASN